MALLTGFKKIKTAVFISGTGSNLKSLIKFSKLKKSPISIEMIVSNNVKSKGLAYGKIYKIKKKIFNFKKQITAEKEILLQLRKDKIDLICLAGFMKILSKQFIENYNDRILNIHPSLLPKYRGLNTHARVLASDDRIAGCSVHLVTPKLDAGPVLAQAKVLIGKNETQDSLAAKILVQEHILYPKALLNFSNQIRNLLEVKNSK
jgi:formyltetrahydrofolate-dependent phosphoribosylglycinamide formyltransferase